VVLECFYALYPRGVHPPSQKSLTSPEVLRREAEKLLFLAFKGFVTKSAEDKGKQAFVASKRRMYFRSGALEYLEAVRLLSMEPATLLIQKVVRNMDLLESRCKDDQLYEDVTLMALQVDF
jgi:hypothetical protein